MPFGSIPSTRKERKGRGKEKEGRRTRIAECEIGLHGHFHLTGNPSLHVCVRDSHDGQEGTQGSPGGGDLLDSGQCFKYLNPGDVVSPPKNGSLTAESPAQLRVSLSHGTGALADSPPRQRTSASFLFPSASGTPAPGELRCPCTAALPATAHTQLPQGRAATCSAVRFLMNLKV